ncbi:MAG TPA: aspartate aminotransferase family protein [Thermoplasmata archaeon]|nr:aspartate aminotransferase family protein [Thermoplasmata archaeon]
MNSKRIDRSRIKELTAREEKRFVKDHPKSRALFKKAQSVLLAGVPMNWMIRWAGSFPLFVKEGKGSRITDVDGNNYIDFCLGDTGSMFGHSPKPVADAVARQVRRGITMMLPTEDSIWVGKELGKRFGLPYWQIVMTATDANRYSIRIARMATRRKKILVIDGCYHGSVDEALVSLEGGKVVPRKGNLGAPIDPAVTTKVVDFNDIPALEKALSPKDVACVLMEPAMTNHGIILPDAGYHDAMRDLTLRHGTVLIMDETHTLCCGIGGYTGEHGLDPDIITMGKPLASGVPVAAYGMSQRVTDMVFDRMLDDEDESGIGGTLSGNALAVAAVKSTLEKVYTEANFRRMMPLAQRFSKGVEDTISAKRLPWQVTRLGVRIEYSFMPRAPRNGAEVDAYKDSELEKLMHLMALNRRILLTPFHNMALISPATSRREVDLHTEVFEETVSELLR